MINTTPPATTMCILTKEYELNASPEKVFEALVNADVIQIWSADEAKMTDRVGFEFSLWSGQITGTNTEVIKNKKLVQTWHYDTWKEASKVTITLKAIGEKTLVSLVHEDVPEKALRSIADGWDSFYFGAIQDMFNEKL
jgi:uncharacterized protein YndB with AHSA1/START domain